MIKKIPLPKGKELTDEEFSAITNRVLFLLGAVCDDEINVLLSKLDELIVGSVYKLDLKRPRKSVVRNGMINNDTKKLIKQIDNDTIPGLFQENTFELIMHLVYTVKGIDLDALSDDEYDDFIKSADPQMYKEIREEEQFRTFVETLAKQEGVKIVHKDELAEHPGGCGFSLKGALTSKNPQIKTAEELMQDNSSKSGTQDIPKKKRTAKKK